MLHRRIVSVAILLALTFALSVVVAARAPLTFEERVKAQEAIERVYYAHRIWPKENPQPKPPFEEMVPREVIEAKVTNYLQEEVALARYWNRIITPVEIQVELDRWVRESKDPETLTLLFHALKDDPTTIAECLARPMLVDQAIHDAFANDHGIHQEARLLAEDQIKAWELGLEPLCPLGTRYHSRVAREGVSSGEKDNWDSARGTVSLPTEAFSFLREELESVSSRTILKEEKDHFVVTRLVAIGEGYLDIESMTFAKTGFEVWWDSILNILQVNDTEMPPLMGTYQIGWDELASLAVCQDTWTATSTGTNCPVGRFDYAAYGVWTGSELIVWGGYNGSTAYNSGGRYYPATNTWLTTSTGTYCPSARWGKTCLWTGTEMFVWGGKGTSEFIDGGLYNPSSNSWRSVSTTSAPSARHQYAAVWTGSKTIIWGGWNGTTSLNTGGVFDPAANTWVSTSTSTGCPTARGQMQTVWTGSEMVVWGGADGTSSTFYNTGSRYNPTSQTWTTVAIDANTPSGRSNSSYVWTGSEMVIWGGYNLSSGSLNTGGRYAPASNSWKAISSINRPAGRHGACFIWSGNELILWGGSGGANTGGRYNPQYDSWISTSTGSNVPPAAHWPTGVWRNTQMIVWGGSSSITSGGVYSIQPNSVSVTGNMQPRSGTAPLVVNYSSTATPTGCTGAATYLWDFGDSGTSTQQNPSHSYAAGGIYQWDIVASVNGVTGTTSGIMPVNPPFTCQSGFQQFAVAGYDHSKANQWLDTGIDIQAGATLTTSATGTVCLDAKLDHCGGPTGSIGGGTCGKYGTLLGKIGTGGSEICLKDQYSGVIASPGRLFLAIDDIDFFNNYGQFDVCVKVTPPCLLSCTATSSPSNGQVPLSVTFSASATTTNCTGATTFAWTFGDGETSTQQNPTHTYSSAGIYNWTMTATAQGVFCQKNGTVTVTPPCSLICTANATPTSGVSPLAVNFSASATASYCSGTVSYSWTFGDGAISGQKNPKHTYANPGTYNWSMTATVSGVACSKTGTITATAPCTVACTATINPTSGQAPLSVNYSASATPTNCQGTVSYAWNFGDGGTSTQASSTYTYTAPGTYSWTMASTVSGVTCTKAGTVTVSQVPVCSLSCIASATPDSGAVPLSVNFVASATPTTCTGPVAYAWDFGDGGTSIMQNPTYSYTTPGTFTWAMTASIQGVSCTQSGTINVSGVCQLACSADAPATGSVGALVAFIATATPSYCQGTPSFGWTFGDGGTSVIQNPRHTYLNTGEYAWTMTAIVDGTTCTKNGTIVIGGNCSLTCTGTSTPESGMAPLTVNFVGSATPTQCLGTPTYTWDFGDGQNSTTPAPTHTYTQPGTYAWTLVVTVDGIQCVQEGTITATANPNPPLLTLENTSAAPGRTVTIPVTLTGRGATICGLTTDISYNPALLTFSEAQLGPAASAAGKSLNSSTPSSGVLRLAIIGINVTPIGDGIVANVDFQVAAGASGSSVLNHSCGATDCNGTGLGMSCPGGIVSFTTGVPGDCDGDGQVSIGEVQKAINMFLGLLPVGCGVDCNGDGAVSIGEVQKVINVFLGLATGC